MKKFVVVREPYVRYGGGEPIELNLYEAEDLDALILELEDGLCPKETDWDEEENGQPCPSPSDWLKASNGDGMDYWLIKELLPDGTLSEDLLEGE